VTPSPSPQDPFALLSARDAAALVDCTEADLRMRERDGELFSFRIDRRDSPLYTAFELMPPCAGSVMRRLLAAVGPTDGASAFMFFHAVSDYLGGLCVAELLVGRRSTSWGVDEGAAEVLAWPLEDRIALALKAAEDFKAHTQGW